MRICTKSPFNFADNLFSTSTIYSIHVLEQRKRDKSVSFVNLVWCMIWRYFWLEAIAEKISWRFYNQFFVCCITLTLQSHVSILKKNYIPSLIIYFICEKNVLRVLVCRDSCLPQKSSSIFRILKLWLCFNGCRIFFPLGLQFVLDTIISSGYCFDINKIDQWLLSYLIWRTKRSNSITISYIILHSLIKLLRDRLLLILNCSWCIM